MSKVKTLDYLAAKTAQNMVEEATKAKDQGGPEIAPKELENLITKALGVLQAQGVYAMFLYLYSQANPNHPASVVLLHVWNMLNDDDVAVPLPENVRVVRLQNRELLFCEPGALRSVTEKSHRDQSKAQKALEEANRYVDLVKEHIHFWEQNREKFPELKDRDLSDLKNLKYEASNLKVQASNSELHKNLTALPSVREIILANIRDFTADLDTLLLVRDLYEQTLMYARYHAKALTKNV